MRSIAHGLVMLAMAAFNSGMTVVDRISDRIRRRRR